MFPMYNLHIEILLFSSSIVTNTTPLFSTSFIRVASGRRRDDHGSPLFILLEKFVFMLSLLIPVLPNIYTSSLSWLFAVLIFSTCFNVPCDCHIFWPLFPNYMLYRFPLSLSGVMYVSFLFPSSPKLRHCSHVVHGIVITFLLKNISAASS